MAGGAQADDEMMAALEEQMSWLSIEDNAPLGPAGGPGVGQAQGQDDHNGADDTMVVELMMASITIIMIICIAICIYNSSDQVIKF